MNVPGSLSPDVLGTPEGIADPYPAYRAFRDASPVRYLRLPAGPMTGRTEPLYSWAVLRHADVLGVVRDPAAFSSDNPRVIKTVPKMVLLHDDPPQHTRLRRLMSKAFSAQRIATFGGWIRDIAGELLGAAGSSPVDFMAACAVPLPIRVIAKMLGIPDDNYSAFKSWSQAVVAYAGLPAEERARKIQELMKYLAGAIAERRAQPGEDLLSTLIEAEVEGARLSDQEVLSFAALLLVAGNETTTNLIGNMMGLLADRPELWRRAREDRSLVEPIIEETLRYESPVQRFPRVTNRPVKIAGVEIGEGELVDVFYGAANRDPAVFDDPDTFRPGRAMAAEHIGFGLGTHYCLGAPLARLEAQVTLNLCLDRFSTLTRGAEPAVRQQIAQLSLGYKSLPLALELPGS